MSHRKQRISFRLLALLLCFVFLIPIPTQAAEPRASYYLSSYTAYICHMGGGELQIWFSVAGVDEWADIGVLDIFLYESQDGTNYNWVKTLSFENYPEMLDHDSSFHMSYVTYQGKLARYYRAYVCIWAGDENNNGDTRYIWTEVEFASPFT